MKHKTFLDDPIEFVHFLKKNGMLDLKNQAICADILTDPENKDLFNDYKQLLAPAIIHRQLMGSPFPVMDASVLGGEIGLAFSENGSLIGMARSECHVLISGQTGSGKTILLKSILEQAIKLGSPVWVFVRAPDFRCLTDTNKNILIVTFDGSVKINPLNPCGLSENENSNVFLDNFTHTQHIYAGTKNYLLQHISILYRIHKKRGTYPTMHDLLYYIKSLKPKFNSRDSSYRDSSLNRLGGLLSGPLGRVFDCSRGHEESLMDLSCIYEIGTLTTEQQQFFVNLMISKLFYYRLTK